MKVRFSASFVARLGDHTRKTRRFVGTLEPDQSSDLTTLVVGMLAALRREEDLGEVHALKITASVVRSRKGTL